MFSKYKYWMGALALLIIFQGVMLKSWNKKDNRPLGWDEAIHTQVAMDYTDRIKEEGFFSVLKPAYFNYPPLYHLTLRFFIHSVDDVADAGAVNNFFYLILLLVIVFILGNLYGGPWAGFGASVLIGFYPINLFVLRITMVDLALTALVALSFLFLLKSENFKNVKWSIGFGIIFALSMLMKWSAIVYLAAPIVYFAIPAFRDKKYKGILLALLVFLALAGPWYIENFIPVTIRTLKGVVMTPASEIVFNRYLNWLWYPTALFKQMNLIFVLLFIPGFILGIKEKRLRPLLVWFIFSLFFWSLIGNRNVRYTQPALPAAAILSVLWIPNKRKFWIGLYVVSFCMFFAFIKQTAQVGAFNIGPIPITFFPVHPPEAGSWKHDEIIDYVVKHRDTSKPFTRILTISNVGSFHSTTINVSLRRRGIENLSFTGASKSRWTEFSEFILFKTGNLGPNMSIGRIQKYADIIQNPPDWFQKTFKEVERWQLADDSFAVLYQADPSLIVMPSVGLLNLELDTVTFGGIEVAGFKMKAQEKSKTDTSVGKLKSLQIECGSVFYKNISFNGVRIELIEPQVNIPLFLEENKIEFLSIKEIKINAEISKEALLAYAAKKVKWLEEPDIEFNGSEIFVSGKVKGYPLLLRANVWIENQLVKTKLTQINFAGVPIPLMFVESVTNRTFPLSPNREAPFTIGIKEIKGEGGFLKLKS